MLCYGTKIGKQTLSVNELGNDDEQSMCEKALKDDIDAIKKKIDALTEEKEKCEKEYRRMCNLKKYRNVLKEDSSTNYREFRILIGCRENERDNKHWSNILIDDSAANKISIQYPLSVDFDREFRELIYKYLNNSDKKLIIL